jgi:hypothetical protein
MADTTQKREPMVMMLSGTNDRLKGYMVIFGDPEDKDKQEIFTVHNGAELDTLLKGWLQGRRGPNG